MAVPHVAAEPGDFTPAVLMPGDPKRVQRIAELLIDDVRLVTDVRGMLDFTEAMNDRPLNVMSSEVGQSSFTIYAVELLSQSGAERVIQVGTAGALSPKVKVGDVIVTTDAHTDSSMDQLRIPGANFNAVAGFRLASVTYQASQFGKAQAGGAVHLGTVMPRGHFYFTPQGQTEALASYGALGMEMKAAALYGAAAEYDRQALVILTVSDHLLDHSSDMSVTEHGTRFTGSLCLAMAAAHN